MLKSRLTFRLSMGLSVVIGSLLISGCSREEPILMPDSQITRLVLDLSGSNDSLEQYKRAKSEIYRELSSNSLGNPFGANPRGPTEISLTFIMSSASRAGVQSIVPSNFGFDLFSDLKEVYGRTASQLEDDWALVLNTYSQVLSGETPNQQECEAKLSQTLFERFGKDNSAEIASRICKTTNGIIDRIEQEIPSSLMPGGGSDVFGALIEIQSWAKKIKDSEPSKKIKVVFASDMVHNADSQRDFFGAGGILTGKLGENEVCPVAKQQALISSLALEGINIVVIGRGNSENLNADEADSLRIFWNCFTQASGFEINFATEGN